MTSLPAAVAVVDAIIVKWAKAFGMLDAEALATLYSDSALFYGSVPTLFADARASRPISTA